MEIEISFNANRTLALPLELDKFVLYNLKLLMCAQFHFSRWKKNPAKKMVCVFAV